MRNNFRHHFLKSAAGRIFAQSVHFPFVVMAINLGHDLRRMRTIAGQLVACDFCVIAAIDDSAKRIFNLRKVLTSKAVDGEDQSFHVSGNAAQVHHDLLIIAFARTGAVIAGMANAAVFGVELLKP